MDIGIVKNLSCGFDEAVTRVTEALKTEGFGVLTTIDVKETLKKKLDVDFRRYVILGACNPPIAHKALSAHPGFGVLMPCNVTVFEGDDGKAVVRAVDPNQTVAPQVSKEMAAVANEVRQKLVSALEKV